MKYIITTTIEADSKEAAEQAFQDELRNFGGSPDFSFEFQTPAEIASAELVDFLEIYLESHLDFRFEDGEITNDELSAHTKNPTLEELQAAWGNMQDNLHDMCKEDGQEYINQYVESRLETINQGKKC